jgi:hypothetical protein
MQAVGMILVLLTTAESAMLVLDVLSEELFRDRACRLAGINFDLCAGFRKAALRKECPAAPCDDGAEKTVNHGTGCYLAYFH